MRPLGSDFLVGIRTFCNFWVQFTYIFINLSHFVNIFPFLIALPHKLHTLPPAGDLRGPTVLITVSRVHFAIFVSHAPRTTASLTYPRPYFKNWVPNANQWLAAYNSHLISDAPKDEPAIQSTFDLLLSRPFSLLGAPEIARRIKVNCSQIDLCNSVTN